jgi:hypothetical protein
MRPAKNSSLANALPPIFSGPLPMAMAPVSARDATCVPFT